MITAAALTFPHLQACVTSLSGPCDAPVRQTVVTCSNAIQVTIYNCRNSAGSIPVTRSTVKTRVILALPGSFVILRVPGL